MTTPIKKPKKLIEVALPLDDINAAAAREKSIRHGHPSTLHLWWARRPLAAARAVIFAQMVNDPGFERSMQRGVNKEKAQEERERLFNLIRRLVLWENSGNEEILNEAREEIWKSWRETCALNRNHPQAAELFDASRLPATHDPFAGGGALPLEAQRLGLESFASDLNPVAALINKAMIEFPPRFADREPVGEPAQGGQSRTLGYRAAQGLAEDVRRYGAWVREQAHARIGRLYPKVRLPKENGGGEATVIAWLWVRTVRSPNPAFSSTRVPLASSFVLSAKPTKATYVEPIISGGDYRFEIKAGVPPEHLKTGTKLARGANFRCILSDSPISPAYIKAEGVAGHMGQRLMAIVAEGPRGRIYLPPTPEDEALANSAEATWSPQTALPDDPRAFWTVGYGITKFSDLFTARQLVALNTLSELVQELPAKARQDAIRAGVADDERRLAEGGVGATAYGEAIAVYLSFALSRSVDRGSTICSWDNSPKMEALRNTFARQALPMTWDFAEGNPFSESSGNWMNNVEWVAKVVERLPARAGGQAMQQDASTQSISAGKIVTTDPPYYDNIGYADLSDFFYVWLRRTLRTVLPELFSGMAAPKVEELVATPYRHGGKDAAEQFFLGGMTEAMRRLAEDAHPAFPTTIYYAFKQSDTTDIGTGNTGWETFLDAVLTAGFSITGTWPMRTELGNRMIGRGTNALASSIVLVCRQRERDAATISRRDFLRELKDELREAVEVMIGGSEGISPVAPVDLAQAVIGPGMAVFSKYAAVLEADGSRMSVHTALTLINRVLTEGGDEFDADTHFCLSWFDEMGWAAGEFGKADVLARAKGTSVDGVRDAGVIEAASGRVRLLKTSEYPSDWSPEHDNRTPVWEALHQMIRALQSDGETSAGRVLARLPESAERIRSLAYRLYTLCERKSWADEARGYNALITSWLGVEAAAHEAGPVGSQTQFDL
ncbi:hypothetical protein AWB73_01130 [Caballeronia turbans]|nr:hypothetical protein AWB73_01130 [Caballeronia turbans]